MQFKAGYIVDSIGQIINEYKSRLNKRIPAEQKQLDQIKGLLQYVSSFDIDFPHKHNPDYKKLNPVLATLNNIVTRGLPTSAPLLLEKLFSKINLTEPNIEEFEFHFPKLITQINYDAVFELLHVIEPNLEINRTNYGGNLDSNLEWDFIKNNPFLKQILESQRDFSTINKKLTGNRTVDFCFTSPYLHWNNNKNCYETVGRIFEVDGPHHSLSEYRYYDAYRDAIAEEENFETIRFSTERIREDNIDFEALIGRKIYHHLKNNFNKEIKEHLAEYSLIFIPISVARIHKAIIEFLLVHPDYFKKEKIKVAIVERDLPCGAIAIKTLQELFLNINSILKDCNKLNLPEIELTIFETSKWVLNTELHLKASIKDERFFKQNHFDIVIDHSVLRRSNIYNESDFQNEEAIKIRSSHYYNNSFGKARRVYCASLLKYQPLVNKNDDGSFTPEKEYESHINYFIQNIFRKVTYWEGQLPIISRALQQKPVIGLLPTGGGKSLTYQLPALLQPGLCLVVDPIKSLMEDQVRVLNENRIDCCDFINSNLNRKEKVKKLIDFRYGETMFLFVSPERFVMEDFRNIIYKIDVSKFGLAFSYCVIDEVHCVSEWGHDFRSTYLMLGENSQRFAKTRKGNSVSLIGLTATASFDVLADIERELQIQHNDIANAIIMIENTIRPELFFRVIDVTDKGDRIQELNNDFSNFAKNLTRINKESVLRKSQKHHFDEFEKKDFATIQTRNFKDESKIAFKYNDKYLIKDEISLKTQNDYYSIIFCPVKGQKRDVNGEVINKKGVDFVYEKLDSNSKGFFYASDTEELSREVQEHFESFTTNKTKHIVCTKAFGMGIDKKDIRSTYHYVYASSLESLIQECGRAGRDKKIAEANILVSKNKLFKISHKCLLKENPSDEARSPIRNTFHRQVLRRNIIHPNFNTEEELKEELDLILDSLQEWNPEINGLDTISDDKKNELRMRILSFLYSSYSDRNIHDYFFSSSYKSITTEKSQIYNLFNEIEFDDNVLLNAGNLKDIFNASENDIFDFFISAEKVYPNIGNDICNLLGLDPKYTVWGDNTYLKLINNAITYSYDFEDYLFRLEEIDKEKISLKKLQVIERKLKFWYNRDRLFKPNNDTGRLIYRMHSMGFLDDYLIDYNMNNLYSCTFNKYSSIDDYLKKIEEYLRRYLSEKSALINIEILNKRLDKLDKPILIDKILECLYFLTEFSYKEIVNKRQRVTEEIENVLNTSITEANYVNDWYQQNLFIKEEIYFYFNAKYARIGFKLNGKPFSLLDDYLDSSLTKSEILRKYIDILKEGTEQNNYKHMMGSCKKILRSLSRTDLNNEWLLRLLKAFAMYSVNNDSYISEANAELERGFDNLYKDVEFHENDFEIIEPIFETYFEKLNTNIQKDNESFIDIKLIRVKLLIKMQTDGIDNIIN